MKNLTFFFFFISAFHLQAEVRTPPFPRVYFILEKLTTSQRPIVERVFFSEVEKLKKEWPGIEFKRMDSPEMGALISVLRDPSTMGVVLLGHPAVTIVGEGEKRRILHGYLQTGSGRYIPKSFLSAAHANMAFVSIITCHDTAVTSLYLKGLPANSGPFIFRSPTHNLDALANPLMEFTSFYSTPELIKKMREKLPELLRTFEAGKKESQEVEYALHVKWRDQLSAHFSYEILADNKLVGTLQSAQSSRGREINVREETFYFKALPTRSVKITIRPDDADRPRTNPGQKVVDDILLDGLLVKNQEGQSHILLEHSFHVGDEENDPDQTSPLSFLRNQKDFADAPYGRQWEGVIP